MHCKCCKVCLVKWLDQTVFSAHTRRASSQHVSAVLASLLCRQAFRRLSCGGATASKTRSPGVRPGPPCSSMSAGSTPSLVLSFFPFFLLCSPFSSPLLLLSAFPPSCPFSFLLLPASALRLFVLLMGSGSRSLRVEGLGLLAEGLGLRDEGSGSLHVPASFPADPCSLCLR